MKQGYALFITLFLVVIISFLSIAILQQRAFSSEIVTLKYLELQGIIHQQKAIDYYKTHKKFDNFSINDARFIFESDWNDENNSTLIYIEAQNKPLRLVFEIKE